MKKALGLFIVGMIISFLSHACELNRTIHFAGNDWDSNSFSTEIARYILENGYACKTKTIYGTSVPLLNALARGDVDIDMELWRENNIKIWNKMLASGRVMEMKGVSIDRATQNFYVPRYLVYGDKARNIKPLAPKLHSIYDIKQYAKLFQDPANPQKGRFYNCKIGWSCEVMNTKKLEAYGLTSNFVNFRTGSGDVLRAEIISALERGKPIFFYYWGPTFLIGKYGKEMLVLKEPNYNKQDWKQLANAKSGVGLKGVAYPTFTIHIAANKKFIQQAPQIAQFLDRFYLNTEYVNEGLVYMNEHNDQTGKQAAIAFIKQNPEVWKNWLPEKVANKILRKLNQATLDQNTKISNLIKLTNLLAIVILATLMYLMLINKYTRKVSAFYSVIIVLGLITFYYFYAKELLYLPNPDHSLIPIRGFIDESINGLVTQYGDVLRSTISYPVLALVGKVERFLSNQVAWLFITALFCLLAYHASKKIGLTLFVFIGNIVIWAMQLWLPNLQTLILIFIAVLLTISIGLPLGIAAGVNHRLYKLLSPLLDVMQTMPSFVYLIPVVMFFGLGTFSGVIATAIYAMPPLVRLTALGIRQVDSELIEAAQSFGTAKRHILTKVQLPLSLPSIMVGINQTIMMALAMVVVASMIGVRGLGQQVLFGLQQQDMGVGVSAGLAIVFLSIMLDRISQAYGQRLQTHYQGVSA